MTRARAALLATACCKGNLLFEDTQTDPSRRLSRIESQGERCRPEMPADIGATVGYSDAPWTMW